MKDKKIIEALRNLANRIESGVVAVRDSTYTYNFLNNIRFSVGFSDGSRFDWNEEKPKSELEQLKE